MSSFKSSLLCVHMPLDLCSPLPESSADLDVEDGREGKALAGGGPVGPVLLSSESMPMR